MTNIYLRMRRIRRIQNQMSREYTFIVDGIEYIDIIKSLNRSQDLNRRREKKYELCHQIIKQQDKLLYSEYKSKFSTDKEAQIDKEEGVKFVPAAQVEKPSEEEKVESSIEIKNKERLSVSSSIQTLSESQKLTMNKVAPNNVNPKMDIIECCCICVDDFEDDVHVLLTKCQHMFHENCLR